MYNLFFIFIFIFFYFLFFYFFIFYFFYFFIFILFFLFIFLLLFFYLTLLIFFCMFTMYVYQLVLFVLLYQGLETRKILGKTYLTVYPFIEAIPSNKDYLPVMMICWSFFVYAFGFIPLFFFCILYYYRKDFGELSPTNRFGFLFSFFSNFFFSLFLFRFFICCKIFFLFICLNYNIF